MCSNSWNALFRDEIQNESASHPSTVEQRSKWNAAPMVKVLSRTLAFGVGRISEELRHGAPTPFSILSPLLFYFPSFPPDDDADVATGAGTCGLLAAPPSPDSLANRRGPVQPPRISSYAPRNAMRGLE